MLFLEILILIIVIIIMFVSFQILKKVQNIPNVDLFEPNYCGSYKTEGNCTNNPSCSWIKVGRTNYCTSYPQYEES